MYRVIKVLNNNGILVYHVETGKEMILLGNGVGFGKKPTEQIEKLPGAKVYSLVTRRKQESVLKTVNGIRPEFIEATSLKKQRTCFRRSIMRCCFRWQIILRLQRRERRRTASFRIHLHRISVCCLERSIKWP